MGNFEDAILSTFRGFQRRSFCDGKVGDGGGGMNAICSRPEVADDATSGIDIDTYWLFFQ